MKPITPNEIAEKKTTIIPDVVIEVFNHHIARNFTGGKSLVKQEDVVHDLVERGIKRQAIFDQEYLDIEPMFQAAGWKVEYHKPGYNETYPALFTFTATHNTGSKS